METRSLVFGCMAVVMAAYALNRGIYVGSSATKGTSNNEYWHHCLYLFPSGIHSEDLGVWDTLKKAENDYCTLFLK
jgi:hypothetical protein